MSHSTASFLEFALLGLIHERQPCSGYDLRKVFAETPMGRFSDSPGSIYPALARLERAKMIHGRIEESGSVRRRKIFRLTALGSRTLKQWLGRPITSADMLRSRSELALRFAFLERVLGRQACVPFLEAMIRELAACIPALRKHLNLQRATNTLSAGLAMELGVMGYESQLAWARLALGRIKRSRSRFA